MSVIVHPEDVLEAPNALDSTAVPVCGGNLQTPVEDQVKYIDEVHYRIGDRLYIENAD